MRRSSSICFSPGPPVFPRPPLWRSKWVHPRTRRVERCSRRASSTCRRPSLLLARRLKISRINSVRSITARPVAFAMLRSWAADNAASKTMTSAPEATASPLISSILPLPRYVAGSGLSRRACIRPTGSSASLRTSSVSSSAASANDGRPMATVTRKARAALASRALSNWNFANFYSSGTLGMLTARVGTTVLIACL